MSTFESTDIPSRRRIGTRDFVSTFGTNLVIQFCTIVQAIFLARLLGPTGRGQFAAAILWPTIFAAVGGMGVSIAITQRSATATDLGRLTRTAILLTLITSALATLCCAALLPWLLAEVDEVSRTAAWYFLPYIVFNHVTWGLMAIDQGAGRFRQYNLTRLIINPVYLVMIIGLWLSGIRDVEWYVIGLMAANGLETLVRVVIAVSNYSIIGPLEPVLGVTRQALPYGAAGLISPLLQSTDKALVLYLVGTTQLGIYSTALTAASVINSLTTSAGTISFGIAAQEQEIGAFPRVARMFRFTAWIWLVAGTCLAISIPVLLPAIYGNQFSAAIWPAIMLIPAAAFAGQAGILESSMRAQGRAFIGLESRIIGMVVFLAAGWLLAEKAGVLGVTLAFVAAQAVALAVMLFATRWHFAEATWENLMPRVADLRELVLRLRARIHTVGRVAAE